MNSLWDPWGRFWCLWALEALSKRSPSFPTHTREGKEEREKKKKNRSPGQRADFFTSIINTPSLWDSYSLTVLGTVTLFFEY